MGFREAGRHAHAQEAVDSRVFREPVAVDPAWRCSGLMAPLLDCRAVGRAGLDVVFALKKRAQRAARETIGPQQVTHRRGQRSFGQHGVVSSTYIGWQLLLFFSRFILQGDRGGVHAKGLQG